MLDPPGNNGQRFRPAVVGQCIEYSGVALAFTLALVGVNGNSTGLNAVDVYFESPNFPPYLSYYNQIPSPCQ
jgi:hypothetical protein